MTVQWGNVAEWVGSTGTVLTLGLGLCLLWREVRDNRKRHASRVIAWIDTSAGEAYVKNGGDEPVTRVMLALFTAGRYAEPMSGQADAAPFSRAGSGWDRVRRESSLRTRPIGTPTCSRRRFGWSSLIRQVAGGFATRRACCRAST